MNVFEEFNANFTVRADDEWPSGECENECAQSVSFDALKEVHLEDPDTAGEPHMLVLWTLVGIRCDLCKPYTGRLQLEYYNRNEGQHFKYMTSWQEAEEHTRVLKTMSEPYRSMAYFIELRTMGLK